MDLINYILWTPTLLLVTMRVAGMFLVAPVLSEPAVPLRLRALMSVVIGLAVVGRLSQPLPMPASAMGLVVEAAMEVFIGAAIGYAARVIFAGIEIGAFHVGQQMGVALAEVFDPFAEEGSDAVRRMYWMLALVIFLSIGGHRLLIAALLRTFDTLPAGAQVSAPGVLNIATGLLSASFVLALKVAAPVLTAMMLALAALGLLQRSAPQFNILTTNMPIHVMLGLVVMAAALSALPGLIEGAMGLVAAKLSGVSAVQVPQ